MIAKLLVVLFIVLHALVHLIGVRKDKTSESRINNRLNDRVFWLITFVLFLISAAGITFNIFYWWLVAMIATIVSQILIIRQWKIAKYGTIANIIIFIIALFTFTSIWFETGFSIDVAERLIMKHPKDELLTETDLARVPNCVKEYIRYGGFVRKPKVRSFRVVMTGQMFDKNNRPMPFRSVQYNFILNPTRLFFMKAKMFGITVPGYHRYVNAAATMDVRLFGLFRVMHASGDVMNKTETVTLFNDMCFLAPPSLIDERIKWKELNDSIVLANFSNQGISISAELHFNYLHQLINFISYDRTDVSVMKTYKFSTPVIGYREINGYNLFSAAQAIWDYPEGPYTYGFFNLFEINYNP